MEKPDMTLTWIASRAGSAVPLVGIVLALANWYAQPDAAWKWTVAIVVLVVMVIARYFLQLALRRSSGDAASARTFASASSAVVLGAVMVVIPLAVQLAETYGVLNDPDSGKRTVMIIIGLYLAATGNSLPRLLPPVSAMQGNAARAQAFQRLLGWTWVVFGLGFAIAWLVLPMDAVVPVSVTLVVAAIVVTMVQLLRLRRGAPAPAPR
jgi:uncharacterized membrane protein YeiB